MYIVECRDERSVGRNPLYPETNTELQQPGVFLLGLPEDRNVGVRAFPEPEEILVGCLCLAYLSRQGERSAKLQARHCAHWIGENQAAVTPSRIWGLVQWHA